MSIEIDLPLDIMTPSEKLAVIQTILANMAADAMDAPSPAWHGQYLEDREQALADGSDSFIDLDQAEQDIIRMTR